MHCLQVQQTTTILNTTAQSDFAVALQVKQIVFHNLP